MKLPHILATIVDRLLGDAADIASHLHEFDFGAHALPGRPAPLGRGASVRWAEIVTPDQAANALC